MNHLCFFTPLLAALHPLLSGDCAARDSQRAEWRGDAVRRSPDGRQAGSAAAARGRLFHAGLALLLGAVGRC